MEVGVGHLGGYKLEVLIARSQVSEVFLARRERERSARYAIKRILPDFSSDPEIGALFEREMFVARRLRDPNIVEVCECGQGFDEEGRRVLYIAMEYVDGLDLSQLVRLRRRLYPELIAYIGFEVARALASAHAFEMLGDRMPIIHRDVAPQNVLISSDGAVKLADFGVARVMTNGTPTTTDFRGRPAYAAPEQFDAERSVLDTRVDLWQLGVLLWELLCGYRPYEDRALAAVPLDLRGASRLALHVERLRANRRRPIDLAAPHAPEPLRAVIEGLLQPLDDRWPSAEMVLDRLAPIQSAHWRDELARLMPVPSE